MNTKLSVACLSGLSLVLSLGAFAVSSMADGYSDDMNWSYVNGIEEKKDSVALTETTPKDLPCTEGCKGRPETDDLGLKMTYEDEAAPITIKSYGPADLDEDRLSPISDRIVATKNVEVIETSPVIEKKHEKPVAYLQDNVINGRENIQYQTTQQYPISVEYPITVERDITVEQPVIVQQPVIMRRPVVMKQAVTVQRPPQIVQRQPVVMQQQPMFITDPLPQQLPPLGQNQFYVMPQMTTQQQMQVPVQNQISAQTQVPQQAYPQMPTYVSYPIQSQPVAPQIMGTMQPLY